MPSAKDTYTAAQAADIIGVSERRVRQLVAEGKLPGSRTADGTVRIPQQAVNEERKKRRTGGSAPAATTRRRTTRKSEPDMNVDALASAVASAVGQRLEGQLELTRRAETLVRSELDEERARRMHAEARLAEAERQLAELRDAAARKGLFRRRRLATETGA